jgi:hypothetical protein
MNCPHCREPLPPEGARLFPSLLPESMRAYHHECLIRLVAGSVAHQRGECSCFGGAGEDNPALSERENARLALAEFEQTRREVFGPNGDATTPGFFKQDVQ